MENGNTNRLVEIMAEVLDEQRLLRKKTEEGFTSLNLAVGELRLSVMNLAKGHL